MRQPNDGADAFGLQRSTLFDLLGHTTFDVHRNNSAYWSNVPANVWSYALGGYQVIKKWLSYRELDIFGRPLRPEEVQYVSDMTRRIAAIVLLGPALDENYATVKTDAIEWTGPDSLHAFAAVADAK